MWKERRMECVSCGRQYYHWYESCMTCGRTNTIKPKKEIEEKKKTFLIQESFVGLDGYAIAFVGNNNELIEKTIERRLQQAEFEAYKKGEIELYLLLQKANNKDRNLTDIHKELEKEGYSIEIIYPQPFAELNLPAYNIITHYKDIKLKIKKTIIEV